MKRILLILLSLFLLLKTGEMSSFAQQLDSARMNALSSRLSEYFEALKHESLDVQKAECDFLISSCTDSLVRQFVALSIYDHYADSRIMGAFSSQRVSPVVVYLTPTTAAISPA